MASNLSEKAVEAIKNSNPAQSVSLSANISNISVFNQNDSEVSLTVKDEKTKDSGFSIPAFDEINESSTTKSSANEAELPLQTSIEGVDFDLDMPDLESEKSSEGEDSVTDILTKEIKNKIPGLDKKASSSKTAPMPFVTTTQPISKLVVQPPVDEDEMPGLTSDTDPAFLKEREQIRSKAKVLSKKVIPSDQISTQFHVVDVPCLTGEVVPRSRTTALQTNMFSQHIRIRYDIANEPVDEINVF